MVVVSPRPRFHCPFSPRVRIAQISARPTNPLADWTRARSLHKRASACATYKKRTLCIWSRTVRNRTGFMCAAPPLFLCQSRGVNINNGASLAASIFNRELLLSEGRRCNCGAAIGVKGCFWGYQGIYCLQESHKMRPLEICTAQDSRCTKFNFQYLKKNKVGPDYDSMLLQLKTDFIRLSAAIPSRNESQSKCVSNNSIWLALN